MSTDVPIPRTEEPTEDQPTAGPEFGGLLSGLDDLADHPVAEHHDRLAGVHEVLHAALHQPQTTPESGSTS